MRKKTLISLFLTMAILLVFSTSAWAMELTAVYGNPQKSISLRAEPTDTVTALKTNIETTYGIAAANTTLSFNGVVLAEDLPLQDYGIEEGCVVQIRFTPASLSLGVQGIYGASASYVYYGSNNSYPLSWQVLSTAADSDTALWGTQESLLLLSQNVLGSSAFLSLPATYADYYVNRFTPGEKRALVQNKTTDASGSAVTSDWVFSLSAQDAENAAYGFSDPLSRVALSLGENSQKTAWWTGSTYDEGTAYAVNKAGKVGVLNTGTEAGIRPAVSLNKEMILFTSLAQGGKSDDLREGATLNTVTHEETANTPAYKLTLKDDAEQTLSLGKATKEGNLVTVHYSNAPIGPKQYVSALITDSSGGTILYYGKLKNTAGASSGEGTVSLTLPDNFFSDGLQLMVFSEKCKSGNFTDYGGTPQKVSVVQSSDNALSDFGLDAAEGAIVIDQAKGTVSLTAAAGTDLRNLIPTFAAGDGAGVYVNGVAQVSGESVNDFSAPVVYTVVAENGVSRNYTVTVARAVSADATLSSFWVDGAEIVPPFTQGIYNYAAKVSGNTGSVTLSAIANDCRATISGDVGQQVLEQGFNDFVITVTAENGGTLSYALTIVRGTPTLNPFSDVSEDQWFYKDVMDAYEAGILSGVNETTYNPNGTLTRAMTMVMLYRLDGSPTVSTSGDLLYLDVSSNAWYGEAVAWATARNITEGYHDGTFLPDLPVTREELCSFLHRYAIYKNKDNDTYNQLTIFSDADTVSSWALKDVQWCVGNGYLKGSGTDASTLRPQDAATRGEGASTAIQVLEKVLNQSVEK